MEVNANSKLADVEKFLSRTITSNSHHGRKAQKSSIASVQREKHHTVQKSPYFEPVLLEYFEQTGSNYMMRTKVIRSSKQHQICYVINVWRQQDN